MATRIFDLDLAEPLPETISLGGRDRLWLIAWRDSTPVSSVLLSPRPGTSALPADALADAIESFLAEPSATHPVALRALPRVTVVICTRDRPDRLPIALDALRVQSVRDFELIVVDNAPKDDRTRRVVMEHVPHARYLVEPVPGLPRARNTGLRAASGDIVAFTDDDCRPTCRWVESFARSFAAEPRLGCVTGPILPLELETPAQEAMEARGGFNRGFRRLLFTSESGEGPVHPVQAWRFGAGGSMALSRDCLERLGGFDEALWRSEDLDIFYRTLRAGYFLAFEPGATVHHRHLPRWDQLARRLFHWGWGYQTYLDKIVRSDEEKYAERARLEQRNWISYQLRKRAIPALRGAADLPVHLVALELAGGIAGLGGYARAQAIAAKRARGR